MNLMEQIKASMADLRGHFLNLFKPDLMLRTLINTAVVGIVFILLVNLLSSVLPGKAGTMAGKVTALGR